ncbi:MAG: hypothetical protein WC644_04120 [Ignavibacteria bacterium]
MGNNLIWHFGNSGAEEHGPNDSITTTFKGDIYYSLAREVIQNSLDAIDNDKLPVKVNFELFEIQEDIFPDFFKLKDRFKLCSDYFSNDKPFVDFCSEAISVLNKRFIKCLRISDYNTSGLEYSADNKNKFYAFMKAVGVTNKTGSGAGGSFGFGKGAYYAASSVRTIIVSSIYGNNLSIFQGKARLTSHELFDGTKNILQDYTGLFGSEAGKPVTNIEHIPDIFKRTEKGTDITLMGFRDSEEWRDSLIKSVLNNFWFAIFDNKLIVEIDNILISKDNLEQIISSYYSENDNDGSVNDAETWNPYPFFKAVKYHGDPTNTKCFVKDIEILGEVKLYILLKEGLPSRTVFLRRPKMIVYKKTDRRGIDYAGVFVCENEKGNEILRRMENPQHNEWKKNNYKENDKPHPDAKKAEEELKAFVKECMESLMSNESGKPQQILELNKYINIPEDLLPDNDGNGDGSGSGNKSQEEAAKETALEKTNIIDHSPTFIKIIKDDTIIEKSTGTIDSEGEDIILTGTGRTEVDPPIPPPQPGELPGYKPTKGSTKGENEIKIPLKVKYRVMAQKDSSGNFVHILNVESPKRTLAELELFAGVDSDNESKDNLLNIIEASLNSEALNTIKNNRLMKLSLVEGSNLIKIKLDSDHKHSLKINSYEI